MRSMYQIRGPGNKVTMLWPPNFKQTWQTHSRNKIAYLTDGGPGGTTE